MPNLKIFTDNISDEAKKEIDLLLEQEAFKKSKVRIMPDVHAGKGCVIGFTGALGNKVIPSIVGVDIGCGIFCANLGNIDIDLKKLDAFIKENIPSGMNVNKNKVADFDLTQLYCYKKLKRHQWIENSIGSLGGGNHFIEIDIATDKEKYLVIHSGSRNLGAQVANYYQDLANQICNQDLLNYQSQRDIVLKTYKELGKEKEIQTTKELVQIIESVIPSFAKHGEGHPAKRTFQAIRIEVNDEIKPLYNTVKNSISVLNKGGRLCIITFHSLEDRAVKNAYIDAKGKCTCPSDIPYCVCNFVSLGNIITKKPIIPSLEEQKINSRSKSAKLRIFERT